MFNENTINSTITYMQQFEVSTYLLWILFRIYMLHYCFYCIDLRLTFSLALSLLCSQSQYLPVHAHDADGTLCPCCSHARATTRVEQPKLMIMQIYDEMTIIV